MAGLITVRLSRSDSQPWGFRLQGGKDFGTPLLIQKVNGGSLAERAGLQVADAVIKVNGQDVYNLSHKGAQDTIVKAGNSFEVVVSRGPGSTWKPSVTPVGALPSHAPTVGAPSPVTKTSLAYQGPPSPAIGTGHNVSAKPFSQVNGVGSVKSITSKQYNSPVGLYSEQNIAETLSAQTEVLASGVLGVNFMKNEKAYNANNSEVLKMVQEIDSEPREPEPAEPTSPISGVVVPPPVSGLRHVSAPETKPPSTTAPLQPGQNICADCERLIVGVFVRIKDKNLHVECFKCATCGTSLKNVGYYNINNKLYCDIHAKLVARANPPAPNLDPITIPPGGHIPSGVTAAPLSNFGPSSPQPGTFAPLPFHAPTAPSLSGPKPFGSPAPAPFSVPVSPPSAPAPPPPFSKSLPDQNEPSSFTPESQPEQSKEQVQEIEDIACCMDKSKRMSVCSNEVCTLSEKKSAIKAMESLIEDPTRASPIPFSKGDVVNEAFKAKQLEVLNKSEGIQTSEEGNVQITRKTKVEESFVRSQKMYSAEISSSSKSSGHVVRAESPEMEQIMDRRQMYQSYHDTSRLTPIQHKPLQSDRCLTPEIENLMGKPHGSWSPMPPACFVRPTTPNQIVSFPPDIPHLSAHQYPPRTATPEQFQEARETVERFVDHSKHAQGHTKHVQGHTEYTGSTNQSYFQETGQTQQQYIPSQYIPRSDQSQQPSAFVARGSTDYKFNIHDSQQNAANIRISEKPQNNGNNPPGNQHNNENGHPGKENPVEENAYHENNGNPGNNTNGDFENKPKENESEDAEEKQSRKSSRTDQSQKSSRKTSSVSEEESSRRVFSDFGGPQISSAVNVESVTEGGVQKTSVTKSQKMEYASCEFESSRKSTISQSSGNNALNKASDETNMETKSPPSGEPKKNTDSKFSGGESTNEEEMVTKSQVEEIIKQELNKVFQMAQTMEKTNFGEMYDQKSQQSSSKQYSQQNLESEAVQVTSRSSKETVEQNSTISNYSDKRALTGEVITSTGKLTSGLTIAPESPFTPQALESNYPLPYQNIPSNFPLPRSHPEPPSSKPGYIPITGDRDSPLLQALTIAPDRPYSPLPSATVPETPSFISAPKTQKSSMLEALTTAPKTAVHLKGVSSEISVNRSETLQSEQISETKYESSQKYAPRPTQSDFKPIIPVEIKPLTSYIGTNQNSETTNLASFPPVSNELKSAFAGTTKAQFSSYSESGSQQKEESKQTVISSSQQKHVSASKTERSITPSGLHPPNLLPYYQQNIGEIPLAHRSNSPIPHQIKAPTTTPPRPPSVSRERRGSVKAMSEAYDQQLAETKQTKQVQSEQATSSVSYVSSGVYSSGAVTKAYSYEEEHKSIDAMGYHASPLAGKLPLAGEQTLPKCSSPVLGKLDHTKQVFKPTVSTQQTSSAFRTSIAEQANLKQAPPYFVQEKDNTQTPWRVVQEKDDKDTDKSTFNLPQQTLSTQPPFKLSFPSANKKATAFPEPPKPSVTQPPVAIPDAGPGGAPKSGTTAGTSAPRRGRGILNSAVGVGVRVPLCASCNSQIRGPFITALGKIWCPDHFTCVNANCRRPLQDIGFVEDAQGLYCEYCFEKYLAPSCNKCNGKVKGDCLNAIGKHFHPECFTCAYCGKLFGNSPFFLEDALPYCEADWNELFTTKCFSCGFPIEAGDRWVEALNNNYHSQCFNCTMCKKNLEGQSFLAKGGRPFCKNHAR